MKKLDFYEKVEVYNEAGRRSKGRFADWRTKDYIHNGFRLLFVLVVLFLVFVMKQPKEQNATPPPSSNHSIGDPHKVDLILLKNATGLGAVCLDGSAPGYHFSKGFDSGSRSWLIHIEGVGWCNTVESCAKRKLTKLGSSKFMEKDTFSGILSREKSQNPDFYKWNKVKVRYCDGASFAGNSDSELEKRSKLFSRGQTIWDSILDELFVLGMSNAKQALLSGCSAGGLATLIHCDDFAKSFPEDVKVKCLSDAGFFMDDIDISGGRTMRSFFHDLANLQGVEDSLDQNCTSELKPFQCLFPRNFIKNIDTPVFLVNPSYDSWQTEHIYIPHSSDKGWGNCAKNIAQCNPSELEKLQGYRDSMLRELSPFQSQEHMGMFIDSCFTHCQTDSEKWHFHSPRINNKTIAEAVGDWYFNRTKVQKIDIDCPYPCNPTCDHNAGGHNNTKG